MNTRWKKRMAAFFVAIMLSGLFGILLTTESSQVEAAGKTSNMKTECMPYNLMNASLQDSIVMGGTTYEDAIQCVLGYTGSSSTSNKARIGFNLGGMYDSVSFEVGHIDETRAENATFQIYMDGEEVGTYTLTYNDIPKKLVYNVEGITQLEFAFSAGGYDKCYYGIGALQLKRSGAEAAIDMPAKTSNMKTECMPYNLMQASLQDSIVMGGTTYEDAIQCVLGYTGSSSTSNKARIGFNLGGMYDSVSFEVGHIDGTRVENATFQIYMDGEEIETYTLAYNDIPKKLVYNVEGITQLEFAFSAGGYDNCYYGIGAINMLSRVPRIYGGTRYDTSFAIADAYKEKLGVSQFQNVIVSCGNDFPDALAGGYLASVKQAPILMFNNKPGKSNVKAIEKYVKANLKTGGTVYLLGGTSAVSNAVKTTLSGSYTVKRLGGSTRYETNLAILEEAGVGNKDIVICTAQSFADSLSASALKRPILLVNNKKGELTAEQKAFLAKYSANKKYIIGGESAVSKKLENQIKAYGTVERIYGSSRYETSVKVAKKFFDEPESAVLAYGKNYPDGLCGGVLAVSMDAPLILTNSDSATDLLRDYIMEAGVVRGAVLGGPTLITPQTVQNAFQ